MNFNYFSHKFKNKNILMVNVLSKVWIWFAGGNDLAAGFLIIKES